MSAFVASAGRIKGIAARCEADPVGMRFSRACLRIHTEGARLDATALVNALKAGSPSIWVMEHRLADAELVLELVQLHESELDTILAAAVRAAGLSTRLNPAQR